MCLLLVGITLRMAPLIDDMGKSLCVSLSLYRALVVHESFYLNIYSELTCRDLLSFIMCHTKWNPKKLFKNHLLCFSYQKNMENDNLSATKSQELIKNNQNCMCERTKYEWADHVKWAHNRCSNNNSVPWNNYFNMI